MPCFPRRCLQLARTGSNLRHELSKWALRRQTFSAVSERLQDHFYVHADFGAYRWHRRSLTTLRSIWRSQLGVLSWLLEWSITWDGLWIGIYWDTQILKTLGMFNQLDWNMMKVLLGHALRDCDEPCKPMGQPEVLGIDRMDDVFPLLRISVQWCAMVDALL